MCKKFRVNIIATIICLLCIGCGVINSQHQPASENVGNLESEKIYTVENIEGIASIENLKISNGNIEFQICNQTEDNYLYSAYLEYIRLENGEEKGRFNLDCDSIDISATETSDVITFVPHKYIGDEGVIRFKTIIFRDSKDNFYQE